MQFRDVCLVFVGPLASVLKASAVSGVLALCVLLGAVTAAPGTIQTHAMWEAGTTFPSVFVLRVVVSDGPGMRGADNWLSTTFNTLPSGVTLSASGAAIAQLNGLTVSATGDSGNGVFPLVRMVTNTLPVTITGVHRVRNYGNGQQALPFSITLTLDDAPNSSSPPIIAQHVVHTLTNQQAPVLLFGSSTSGPRLRLDAASLNGSTNSFCLVEDATPVTGRRSHCCYCTRPPTTPGSLTAPLLNAGDEITNTDLPTSNCQASNCGPTSTGCVATLGAGCGGLPLGMPTGARFLGGAVSGNFVDAKPGITSSELEVAGGQTGGGVTDPTRSTSGNAVTAYTAAIFKVNRVQHKLLIDTYATEAVQTGFTPDASGSTNLNSQLNTIRARVSVLRPSMFTEGFVFQGVSGQFLSTLNSDVINLNQAVPVGTYLVEFSDNSFTASENFGKALNQNVYTLSGASLCIQSLPSNGTLEVKVGSAWTPVSPIPYRASDDQEFRFTPAPGFVGTASFLIAQLSPFSTSCLADTCTFDQCRTITLVVSEPLNLCLWDNGLVPQDTPLTDLNGQESHVGGGLQTSAKAADDFTLCKGFHKINRFRAQMITTSFANDTTDLRSATLEFYDDCNGSPALAPFAVFDSTFGRIIASARLDSETTLVTYDFDLCDAKLWLTGDRTYWVSIIAQTDGLTNPNISPPRPDDLSQWVTSPPGCDPANVQGSVPRFAVGTTVPLPGQPPTWGPWEPITRTCVGCRNLAFELRGESCKTLWDNGAADLGALTRGGSITGRNGTLGTHRSADQFVAPTCDTAELCAIEAWVWTNCFPGSITATLELYDTECRRGFGFRYNGPAEPPLRTWTIAPECVFPTGQTFLLGSEPLRGFRLLFDDLNFPLQPGRNYWIAVTADDNSNAAGTRTLFAYGARCVGCPIRVGPAVTRRISPTATTFTNIVPNRDLAFRVHVRRAAPDASPVGGTPGGGTPSCAADLDLSGHIDSDDVYAFIDLWFAGCP